MKEMNTSAVPTSVDITKLPLSAEQKERVSQCTLAQMFLLFPKKEVCSPQTN
jgi:hypothetical protein